MSLDIRNLEKSYGDFTLSLDLSVAGGETLILAGPSGCGKTTALNLIAGLGAADRGSVSSGGKELSALPAWKRNIAVVFQDLALFPHLSAGGNIGYGPFIRGMKKRDRRRLAEEKLELVRLKGFSDRPVDTLSGGEKQRVAIARALAMEPAAMLLDEPFSSLDAPLRRELRKEFLSLRQGSSFPCVFVTHDREEAAMLGDRIALMEQGRIIETGAVRDLFLAPEHEFTARFLGFGQVLDGTIGEAQNGAIPAHTPLGTLFIRGEPYVKKDGGALVFVPRDGVRPARLRRAGEGAGTERGRQLAPALFKRGVFEGDRMVLTVELPGGLEFSVDAGPRERLPAGGEKILLSIDLGLLKFLKPSSLA